MTNHYNHINIIQKLANIQYQLVNIQYQEQLLKIISTMILNTSNIALEKKEFLWLIIN